MSGAPRVLRPPRLLFLGHNLPFPPHEGALIRSYHTLRILSREFDVTAAHFFRRTSHPTENQRQHALEALRPFGSVAAHPIPQEFSPTRFISDHILSSLTHTPYTRWVHESRSFREALREWTRRLSFDLIHVDSLDLLAYLPDLPKAHVVVAHHNVESALLRRRADHEGGLRGRYIRHQANLVEQAERHWCRRVDLNIAVSPEDAGLIRDIAPGAKVLVIPNGVDTKSFAPSAKPPTGDIVFVGGYSWFPNADGMHFFATEILPLIRSRRAATRVRWIGKITEQAAQALAALGVEALGYVDDIRPVLEDAQCVIVPLRVGGGTRLKILDAWAMGKAVVSTTVGSEGLQTCDGANILLADTADAFASATLRVLENDSLRRALERGGRETAVRAYDWDVVGSDMLTRYKALLNEPT